MHQFKEKQIISQDLIRHYCGHLMEQEKAYSTILQYSYALHSLLDYLADAAITKTNMINWKVFLTERYAPASVNAMVAAANGFLDYYGYGDCKVKSLKIQHELFSREEKELSRNEYIRLVRAAENSGNPRLSLILQTICATGIRVSELQFITVETLRTGRAEVNNKGKRRTIFLPEKLRRSLSKYIKMQKKTAGPIFITKSGKPLNRSNIWREMKALCDKAHVEPDKVFPHNLRHLFARTFYGLQKDLSRLADLLGHTSINTTRIYTKESGMVHARQMSRMELVIT